MCKGDVLYMGNEINISGANIIYESLAEVHVSGHAYQEELKTLHTILKPKFFIPVHGEYRHLRAHCNIARDLGMNDRNMLIPEIGDTILISKSASLYKRGGFVI